MSADFTDRPARYTIAEPMFKERRPPHLRELIYSGVLITMTLVLAIIGLKTPTQLDAIRQNGVLRVATTNTPMTYFIRRVGTGGVRV